MISEATLAGGPMDGKKVRRHGSPLPVYVWVAPWYETDDGFTAWRLEPSERFDVAYVYDGPGKYVLAGYR
jgi:hypothetical protein